MKKLFFIIGLFFSLSAMAQPTNYTKINMRYRWLSGMFDSALYVPRYNGTPSGVRVNETSVFDGMIAMDTTNNRLYIYSGGSWIRLAAYSEVAAYTAGNGLTLNGSAFEFGGTLNRNTTITTTGYDYNLVGIPTTTSTTGKKIQILDTATGKVERIDPALIGGGGSTLYALTGSNTATGDVTGSLGSYSLTSTNNRGSFVFDNAPSPLVKINGTGLSPLFQVDSGGYTRFRIYPKGQIFAGDSINLNLFIGYNSGLNIAPEGPSGQPPGRWNVGVGTQTLMSLVNGNDNVAVGQGTLAQLVDGTHNIALGTASLGISTTGDDNVSIGVDAMVNNSSGNRNVGVGSYTQYLATGSENTSLGYGSLYGTVSGSNVGWYNTAIGNQSARSITSASANTAIGNTSLYTLSTGGASAGSNTALGASAGYSTNGDYNLFIGNSAGAYSNESNAFYLHTLISGMSNENDNKNYSMLYGKFANAGANKLRMNGKFGIHSLNNDASWLPDSTFHVVGNSWLNGKLRITDGTQSNGYVLTSDANGNASWQASSSGFTNPMTTEGDLILATTGGTATRLGIGANGYVLTSNGTTASWQAASGGGGGIDSATVRNLRWKYRNTFELMDEFLGNGIAPGWSSQSSGAGSSAGTTDFGFADLDTTWQGATYASTGTTTTGRGLGIYGNATSSNTGSFRGYNTSFAVYETRVRFDTLSNATNEYTALFGWMDWFGSSFYQKGMKFVYDRATYGDFWVLRSDDGGTSAVVTTTAVAAKTDYVLRIEVYNWQMGSSGGSIKAYINDVEVVASSGTYPIESNIAKTDTFYPCYWIQKSAGTVARKVFLDWVYQYAEFIKRL